MAQISQPTGSLPAYVQISEAIARRINAGQFLAGERLPTERNMATEFGVAVGTLRKALHQLQSQGLIQRRHGSGNYINSGRIELRGEQGPRIVDRHRGGVPMAAHPPLCR